MIAWASKIGHATALYIQALLESKKHPEEGYRPALGILRHCDGMDVSIVERASFFALQKRMFRVRQYGDILKSPMIKLNAEEASASSVVQHDNLHGMSVYAEEVQL